MSANIPNALVQSLENQIGKQVNPEDIVITAGPTWSPFHEHSKTIVEIAYNEQIHYVVYERRSLCEMNERSILLDLEVFTDVELDVDAVCQLLTKRWGVELSSEDFTLIPRTLFGETVTLAAKDRSFNWYGYLKITFNYN